IKIIRLHGWGVGVGCREPEDPPRRLTPSAPPKRRFSRGIAMNSMRGRNLSALFLIFCLVRIPGIRAAEKPRLEETPLETLRKIEIFPSQVFLGGQRNTQQLVVEGYYADGYAEDLTSLVEIRSDNPSPIGLEQE